MSGNVIARWCRLHRSGLHNRKGRHNNAFSLGWQPYAHNPVLRTGPPGAFDAVHAHKPFIFRTGDRHFHFYTAVDTERLLEVYRSAHPRA